MFEQWGEFKKAHPNAVILFRVGGFFEMLELDAYIIRKLLGFKMSFRQKGKDYIPMVGFPPSVLSVHVAKLSEHKVGYVVVEQTEELENSGLRKRTVANVVMPDDALDLSSFKKGYESYLIRDFALVVEKAELVKSKQVSVTQGEVLVAAVRTLDIDKMSGFDALKFLFEWQKKV